MTIYFNSIGNHGHLGNQMFQLASLVGIASDLDQNWKIPPENHFGTNYPLRSSIYKCFDLGLSEDNIGVGLDVPSYSERQHSYDQSFIDNLAENCNIDGYFQSERYFRDVSDRIRTMFSFKNSVIERTDVSSFPDNFCALHVRRTDYVGNSLYHTNLTKSYYLSALERLSPENVIVFSDDTEWCKSHSVYSRFVISEMDEYCDLYLMSRANSHIIANSSFSWWGAYLSESSRVVAPKSWFGPMLEHLDTSDYYLDGWERI